MLLVNSGGREEEVYIVDVDAQIGVGSGTVSKNYNLSSLHGFIKELEGELLLGGASLKHRITRFNSSTLLDFKEVHFRELSSFVDEFLISPFVTKIASSGGSVEFVTQEVSRNNTLVLRWLQGSSAFNTSPFRYILPEEVPDVLGIASEGYRGVRTKFDNASWFATLYSDLSYFRMPLIVEVFSRRELDLLEKFIEQNEVGGRLENPLILVPYLREKIRFDLYGLMGVKNVFLCVSSLQLTVLKQLVYGLCELDKEWFKHLIFGTGFPYSSTRDVTNLLTFLLSEDLPGGLRALRWIMGLNAVSFLPLKAQRKGDVESDEKCVVANGAAAKLLLSSLRSIILHVMRRNSISLATCDYLASLSDERVDPNKCFLVLSSVKGEKFGGMLLLSEEGSDTLTLLLLRQDIVRRSRNRFTEDVLRQPEIQAAISNASKLSSGEDVEKWLKWFVEHYKEKGMISYDDINALTVHTFNLNGKFALMNKEDMHLLGLKDGDLVLARTTLTGDWYIVPIKLGEEVPGGELWVDERIINTWYVFDGDTLQIEKFEGDVPTLREVTLLLDDEEKLPEAEKVIENVLDDIIVGQDSRLVLLIGEDMPYTVTVAKLDPSFLTAGVVKKGETKITVVSKGALTPYNLFLVLDLSENMGKGVIPIEPAVVEELKYVLSMRTEELCGKEASRALASSFALSYLLVKMVKVSRLSKVFLLTCSDEINIFSILERRRVSPYLEITPQKQNIMLKVLSSHISDMCRAGCKGRGKLPEAINKVEELLGDLKEDVPFLVLFIVPNENLDEVVKAAETLKKDSRVRTAFISVGTNDIPVLGEKNHVRLSEVKASVLDNAVKSLLNTIFPG
ncbi:MAG: hypothetical protein KIH01_03570 [Candidatus Freyarchaeota archaeon]|nr:hypothetical protein [Candidatus Jordarchaeia archaeon]